MPTSITARFEARKKVLSGIFQSEKIVKIWRTIVRSQLRSQDIKDLNDHYDFNYNIVTLSDQISTDVLSGKYRPDPPLIYRVEKKFGICRHLILPCPNDSLVLQTVVEFLAPKLRDKQPSKSAFYSRDKHSMKLPHDLKPYEDYSWVTLWKRFQKEILSFSENYEWLVVTDIANYYDNIELNELRSVVLHKLSVDEPVLDLLFNVLEQLMWNPDYLPRRTKGLPTINLECVRLLAHVFLFEVDEVLKEKTKNSFVRLIDDINFGVRTKNEGICLISELNDVLKSRGLALNISKTKIYNSKQAKDHFMFDENSYLNNVIIVKKNDEEYGSKTYDLEMHFKSHLVREDLKNWDKVTKRCFTIASKFKTNRFLKYIDKLFLEKAAVRPNILSYLLSLGPNRKTFSAVLDVFGSINSYDDITFFKIVDMIASWPIRKNKEGMAFVGKCNDILSDKHGKFNFYCYLWFCAKYAEDNEILTFIANSRRTWLNDSFLCRQVASVLPRIVAFSPSQHDFLSHAILATGIKGAISVVLNQQYLSKLTSYDRLLKPYLLPVKKPVHYPLPKFLIFLNTLRSEKIAGNVSLISDVLEILADPWFVSLATDRLNWCNKSASS